VIYRFDLEEFDWDTQRYYVERSDKKWDWDPKNKAYTKKRLMEILLNDPLSGVTPEALERTRSILK